MVRTIVEPIPTLRRPNYTANPGSASGYQASKISSNATPAAKFSHSKASSSTPSRLPIARKRSVLGERDDNLDSTTPLQTASVASSRKASSAQRIKSIYTPLSPSGIQPSPSRSAASPWSIRAPSDTMSRQPAHLPRPSFTQLDAGVDHDVTQLLDMRAPLSPSGLTTDSEDDWGSGLEEVGNVTAGRTPMPPRRSLGTLSQWGKAVQGGGRLMTPMASQELTASTSPPIIQAAKIHAVTRLPTPPSSQPAEPASTPQRPSLPIRRRPRPSPTPPRRLQAETLPLAAILAEPSPNPRIKKNPRLSTLGSVSNLKSANTPKTRLEVVLPLSGTSTGDRQKRGARGSQRSTSSPSADPVTGSSASQPMPMSGKSFTPPAIPSSAPQARRRSTPGTQKASPPNPSKPRGRRAGSRKSSPTAIAQYAGITDRRRSMTPAALRKAIGRDIVIGSGVPDVETSPGDDPLLLKSESDDEPQAGAEVHNSNASQSAQSSQNSTRRKGTGRAGSLGLELGVPPSTSQRTVTSFPFRPYTTAPPLPRSVPEWVPRTMRKKKVELDYGIAPHLRGADGSASQGYEAGMDGFGSDYDSDEGGYEARPDDTFVNVLSRRAVRTRSPPQSSSMEHVIEEGVHDQREPAKEAAPVEAQHLQQEKSVSAPSLSGPTSTRKFAKISSNRAVDPSKILDSNPGADSSDVDTSHTAEWSSYSPRDDMQVFMASPAAITTVQSDVSLDDKRVILEGILAMPVQDIPIPRACEQSDHNDHSAGPFGVDPDIQAHAIDGSVTLSLNDPLDAGTSLEHAAGPTCIGAVGDVVGIGIVTVEIASPADTTAEIDETAWDESTTSDAAIGSDTSDIVQAATSDLAVDRDVEGPVESLHDDTGHFERESPSAGIAPIPSALLSPVSPRLPPVPARSPQVEAVSEVHECDDNGQPASPGWAIFADPPKHGESPTPTKTPTCLDVVTTQPLSGTLPSQHDASPSPFSRHRDQPTRTFEETARSSLTSSSISDSEADLTVEAIDGGWDSDNDGDTGEVGGDDSHIVPDVSGVVAEDQIHPSTTKAPEQSAEYVSTDGPSEDTPVDGALDEGARDTLSSHAVREPSASIDARLVQTRHSTIIARETATPSPDDSSSPTTHDDAVDGGDHAEPSLDSTAYGDAAQTQSNASTGTETGDSAPEPDIPVDDGKIVLKLINRGVVKVEPIDTEEEEEEEDEVEEEEQADHLERFSTPATAVPAANLDEEDLEADISQTTIEPEEEVEDDTPSDVDGDSLSNDESDSTGGRSSEPVQAPRALEAAPSPKSGEMMTSVTEFQQAGEVDYGLRTPPTSTVPLSTTPQDTPPLRLRDSHAAQPISPDALRQTLPALSLTTSRPSETMAALPPRVPILPVGRPPSRLREEIPRMPFERSPNHLTSLDEPFQEDPQSSNADVTLDSSFQSEGVSIRGANKSLLAELSRAGGKGKERELRNVVEVSSLDPRAAARAAAILKLNHNYIEHGILPSDTHRTPRPERSSRRSFTSHHFASAESARKLTREELLNEAELEIVLNEATPGRHVREGTAFSSVSAVSRVSGMTDLPLPGSWARTPSRKRSRPPDVEGAAEPERSVVGAASARWGVPEWKRLEKVHRAEKETWIQAREVRPMPGGLMAWARRSSGIGKPKTSAVSWDDMRVVKRFLETEGITEATGDFSEAVILLRVQALERRVNLKLASRKEKISESPTKKAKVAAPPSTPQRLQFGSHTTPSGVAPPSTIKRLVNWVWGTPKPTRSADSVTSAIHSRGDGRDINAKSDLAIGRPAEDNALLRLSRMPAEVRQMRQITSKPTTVDVQGPPTKSALPRLSGRELLRPSQPPIGNAGGAPHSTVPTSTFNPVLPALDTSTSSSSFLGLSTSSTATTATFPPQTPRLYPPLNQSISQRSAAIKALFPAIHPLGDSTSSISSSASTTTNPRPISFTGIPGLSRKTSVKDMARSFEEKGTLDQALKRVPSGASELEALRRVQSADKSRR